MAKESLIGETFGGRFRVTGFLGEGGMGRIYEATDTKSGDKVVALKVLHRDIANDPEVSGRFKREMRAASQVQHPNSVHVYDYGDADGRLFLSMECVEGDSLGEVILDDAPLDPLRAANIGRQIAAALGAAHAQRIIHRDLKPDNVMIEAPGERDIVKVCDFGLAKFLKDSDGHVENDGLSGEYSVPAEPIEHDSDGPSRVGTPHYMSPEYITTYQADHRADIYALGILLYEMVTGRPPFDGSPYEILDAHVKETPLPPSTINQQVPPWLDRVILRLLNKDPAKRPQVAEEVMVLLERERGDFDEEYADSATEDTAGQGSTPQASGPKSSRGRGKKSSKSSVPLLLGAIGGVLFFGAGALALAGVALLLATR